MTTIVVAINADGSLLERLTDEIVGRPPQHETWDKTGTGLVSTVDATVTELDMLRFAAPKM